jgi:SAM-dependent methyltransferase
LARLASVLKRPVKRSLVPIRRRYYMRGLRLIDAAPRRLRARLGFDDHLARGTRKIEIGGGPHAQPGYLHVDVDPHADHLEAVADAWALPFPDNWAIEILSIHQLEHVHPSRLVPTLREWRRVLQPGGAVRVHVPNGPALMEAYKRSPLEQKWPIMGSLLGMYCSPEARGPGDLTVRSDHQIIFDRPMLLWALREAGFEHVEDITEETDDRHNEGWRGMLEHYSIVAQATKE